MYPSYHLEDIVVSLALARKLKENNVVHPTLFYWRVWDDGSIDCAMVDEDDFDYRDTGNKIIEKISAYTATELMERLPHLIRVSEGQYFTLCIYKSDGDNKYVVEYESWDCYGEIKILREFESIKLADALARMRLWLSETGIVK